VGDERDRLRELVVADRHRFSLQPVVAPPARVGRQAWASRARERTCDDTLADASC
jgi:hypothetical protein